LKSPLFSLAQSEAHTICGNTLRIATAKPAFQIPVFAPILTHRVNNVKQIMQYPGRKMMVENHIFFLTTGKSPL